MPGMPFELAYELLHDLHTQLGRHARHVCERRRRHRLRLLGATLELSDELMDGA